tara:strand:+ start:534 stop:1673 length:1140 start_codon:yes stop_codon:yes gene_type:complete
MKRKFWNDLNLYVFLFIKFLIFAFNSSAYANKKINTNIFRNLNSKDYRDFKVASIQWKKFNVDYENKRNIIWEKSNKKIKNTLRDKREGNQIDMKNIYNLNNQSSDYNLSSLNRSIVFGNERIGPDISWIVPPGFKWTKKTKFDASLRGYNQTLSYRRKSNQPFLGWNEGDAVGQFYYQFLSKEKYSLGLNIGIRSVKYGGSGGSTPLGDGLSAGFRGDYKLSNDSGLAIGAEQLIHFDGVTDTGRDIYFSISKGFWSNQKEGNFPLRIATAAFATGRLAEGNIKGLCSDWFGGAGTEVSHQRRLCWAPVFSLAHLFNESFSTFFEYNSRSFLVGSSISPLKKVPLRGTFALTISDHTNNYKINNFDELTWTFRISLGY